MLIVHADAGTLLAFSELRETNVLIVGSIAAKTWEGMLTEGEGGGTAHAIVSAPLAVSPMSRTVAASALPLTAQETVRAFDFGTAAPFAGLPIERIELGIVTSASNGGTSAPSAVTWMGAVRSSPGMALLGFYRDKPRPSRQVAGPPSR
jgi:hypothetical protein